MPEMTDLRQRVSDVMTTVHVIGIPWFAFCLSQARYLESRLTVSRLLSRPYPRVSGLASRAGFTILELITVLVVGGILTSFAMGRVTQIMSSQRLKAASVAVQNELSGAWAIALRNRRPVRISWDASKMQLNITDRAGTTVYRRTTLGSAYGLRSSGVDFSINPLEIYPNGLAADTLRITLLANTYTDTIRVSRAGLVRSK
jgi:prepilin-type N-terminal cleavage/methylation domain-containing protein